MLIALAWVSTLRYQVSQQSRKLRLEIAEREKMGLKREQTVNLRNRPGASPHPRCVNSED